MLQRFGEDIHRLCISKNVGWSNLLSLDFIKNKMTVDFDVFCTFMEKWIEGDMESDLIITEQRSRDWLWNPKIAQQF